MRTHWRVVGVALAGAGLLAALVLASGPRDEPLKVSGFVEADEIRIGSRVGGRVRRVQVQEGQAVKAGEALVQLEPFDLTQRRAEAQAHLAAARAAHRKMAAGFRAEEVAQAKAQRDQLAARLARLKQGPRRQAIAAASAQLKLAEARRDLARIEHQRTGRLVEKQAAPRQQLDEAHTNLKAADAAVEVRAEELAELQEGARAEDVAEAEARLEQAHQAWRLCVRGHRPEEVAEAAAAVAAAEAALARVDRQLAELTLRAPVDGRVEAVELQPGDLVGANAPAISLVDASRLWVRAYVPENRLNIAIGARVEVSIDSEPGRRFQGRVSFIGRQAEFTPGNVQTPEDRSEQVFRIKVTLDDGLDVLRPGMAADVWLAP